MNCIFSIKEWIMIHKLINSKDEIYLEIALTINQNMYKDKKIPYHIFQLTEEKLLEKIKTIRRNSS